MRAPRDGLERERCLGGSGGPNMEKQRFERVSFLCSGLALVTVAVAACSDGVQPSGAGGEEPQLTALCQELQLSLISGSARDGIPALTDPDLVGPDSPLIDFLLPTDRVIGLEINGEYLAFPHNILWWHEIANMNELGLAVTYCPLTGSSMVFQRRGGEGVEFGVSGLLFKNNLVMYGRPVVETAFSEDDSLWPQMLGGGFCGPSEGEKLTMVAAIEIEWEDWLALHPDTRLLSGATKFERDYTRYPYGDYEVESNYLTLAPIENLDLRRPPKERILGIPFVDGQGGIAFPFGALRDAAVGDLAVVHTILGDGNGGQGGVDPVVVFWDGGAAAAMAFTPGTPTRDLTFEVRNGAFVDVETGTQWSIEGKGLSGPLAGDQLRTIAEGYVSFWFAFSQFFLNPVLWLP